jgi:hypothetical protein
MSHKPGRGDPRHRGIGVVDALPAVKAERERQGLGNFIRRRRAEVGFVWHAGTVEAGREHIKNLLVEMRRTPHNADTYFRNKYFREG